MIELRHYQQDFIEHVEDALRRVGSVLGVMATGAGKTVCFAELIRRRDTYAAAVVHRREIVRQISLSLAAVGVRHRVVAPDKTVKKIRRSHLKRFGAMFVDQQSRVGVCSVQTLASRASENDQALSRWLDQTQFAVFDEGHHYIDSGHWARAVNRLDHAKRLFVTACAIRADGKGLGAGEGGFCEELVEGPTSAWLIQEGWLTPFKLFAPGNGIKISDIPLTADGDLNLRALAARNRESGLVGDLVDHWRTYCRGKPTIAFTCSVEEAETLAAGLRAAGARAEALSGETDDAPRDNAIDAFSDGGLDVLANVDLFDEGLDVPGASALLCGRRTISQQKWRQMAGRVLRTVYAEGMPLDTAEQRRAAIAAGPKPYAVIVDAVGNWENLGPPHITIQWSLSGSRGAGRTAADSGPPMRKCLGCTQPYLRALDVCPYCGTVHEPAGRGSIEQVDGALQELDLSALDELMAKKAAANLSPEEYERDQIRRGIPQIGRRQDARRHDAVMYRRRVLDQVMRWWFGVQPTHRSLAERQRRFYLRFGVDVVTAFTLDIKQTDALIARIEALFTEDLHDEQL